MTQAEIAEKEGTKQSYVSSRLSAVRKRLGPARPRDINLEFSNVALARVVAGESEALVSALELCLEHGSDEKKLIRDFSFFFSKFTPIHIDNLGDNGIRFADAIRGFSEIVDSYHRPFYKRCECQN